MKLSKLCNFNAIFFTLKHPPPSSSLKHTTKKKEAKKKKERERAKKEQSSDFKESLRKNYIQGLRATEI